MGSYTNWDDASHSTIAYENPVNSGTVVKLRIPAYPQKLRTAKLKTKVENMLHNFQDRAFLQL